MIEITRDVDRYLAQVDTGLVELVSTFTPPLVPDASTDLDVFTDSLQHMVALKAAMLMQFRPYLRAGLANPDTRG